MVERLVAGGLVLSMPSRQATLDGLPLPLADDEFLVLQHLVATAGNEISRAEIRDAVTGLGLGPDLDERIVDCYLVRLMVKLAGSASPRLLRVSHGNGYLFQIGQGSEATSQLGRSAMAN